MLVVKTKTFNDLSNIELYQLLKLRAEVFIIEQNCVYQDLDDKDYHSYHVLGYDKEVLVAYTRLVPAGFSYKLEPSIGRVVTHPKVRKLGYGKLLMEYSIQEVKHRFETKLIVISAQLYLKHFYQNLGFIAEGEEYLEDNIPHIQMRLSYN